MDAGGAGRIYFPDEIPEARPGRGPWPALLGGVATLVLGLVLVSALQGSPPGGPLYDPMPADLPLVVTARRVHQVLPHGMPPYGPELNVSFDDTDRAVRLFATYDSQSGLDSIDLPRYVAVGSNISCEFCCEAKTLVFPDGSPACSCAHSMALRGTLKYLLRAHPGHYNDSGLLQELVAWKTAYFKEPMVRRALDSDIRAGWLNESVLATVLSGGGSCALV